MWAWVSTSAVIARIIGEGPVVQFGFGLGALEHAAVDEDAGRSVSIM
jgi:hypothetical protein